MGGKFRLERSPFGDAPVFSFGANSEAEQQLLRLSTYIGLNESVIPPALEGGDVAGKSKTRDRHVNCPNCNYRYHYRCAEVSHKGKRRGRLFKRRPRGAATRRRRKNAAR